MGAPHACTVIKCRIKNDFAFLRLLRFAGTHRTHSPTDQIVGPICAHDGSSDAVWSKEVLFGVAFLPNVNQKFEIYRLNSLMYPPLMPIFSNQIKQVK
jgi:hypothetical protein